MAHGYVVSDLHLFAHWSTAEREMPLIRAATRDGEFLVLNGDIFEFRWSVLRSLTRTTEAAMAWLDELAGNRPDRRLVYVMGNHDRMAALAGPLDALAEARGNFAWSRSHTRIGEAVFLHGDLALGRGRGCADPLAAPLRVRQRTRSRAEHLMYRSLVAARVHHLSQLLHGPRYCARRLLRWLARHGLGPEQGVREIYFGHTHRPFSDFERGGLRFHNTGAAIRGLDLHLLRVG